MLIPLFFTFFSHNKPLPLRATPHTIPYKAARRQGGRGTINARVTSAVKGEIQFHWKIIMAPHRIVDYVVVHELCHLKHHDHSLAFWKSVERVVPDYLECKEWLRDVGARFDV